MRRSVNGGGYWPSAEQELLLRAALLPGPDALAAWHALHPRLDVEGATRATHRLLPLLGARLRQLGVDDPLVTAMAAIERDVADKNRRLLTAGRRILVALADAGIATLVLKGGALLALGHYRALGLRPMSDLDVVVPAPAVRTALRVLGLAGWSARAEVSPALIAMRHATDLVEGGSGLKCDLHWHVYWECCAPDADDELWAASVPLDLDGVPTRTLAPADQLLHLCVHGSRRARRPLLLWIPDALHVLRAGGIDWSRLSAQARRRRFVRRAATMLAYLRRQFGAPVPDACLAELDALAVPALERLEYRVGNWSQGLLGELPGYWCHYRRLRADGQVTSPLGFPRYLQQTWGVQSLAAVGRAALDRARRRLRAAATGAAPAAGR